MEDLKKLIEKIDSKLDKVDERLNSVDVTLVKQNAELEHHIYRTHLNEENIEMLRADLKPVKKHVYAVNVVLKVIGAICSAVGFVAGIAKLILSLF